jgi:hypothetical protein
MSRLLPLMFCATLIACAPPKTAPHTAYVSDEQANVLHVIDCATAREIAKIPSAARHGALAGPAHALCGGQQR